MANVANSTLTTNFNVKPYYDDYDAAKNFYRILYRPGFAVQARELTQMQTILQKQIDRFGKHMFREGSIVLPGNFYIEKNVDYIKVKDTSNTGAEVTNINSFLDQKLTGQVNGLQAQVINVADGSESSNAKTLFVRYLSASNTINKFATNEPLTANAGSLVVVSSSPTGTGSRFAISEGVLFAKDHFIYFPSQSIILDKYSSSPTCRVGFNITEEIIRYTQDASLLDPALEASNYSAPGADRLKLNPTLSVLNIDDNTSSPDFVELFTIRDGVIQEIYDRPQYAIIRDEMAKRTYDESGDYYVNGLDVRVRENKNSGTNGGLNTSGDTTKLSVGIEPGKAYVKGYEVGKLITEYVTINKSTTFNNVNGQLATATMGNYIKVNDFVGTLTADKSTTIYFSDVPQNAITNGIFGFGATALGNTLGSAKVMSIVYGTGTLGSATAELYIYLNDISLGSNSFSNIRSVYIDSTSPKLRGDVVLDAANNAVLYDTATATLLYSVGSPAVRTIRTAGSTTDTDMLYLFERSFTGSINTGGYITATISTTGDKFPYGTTTSLGAGDKLDILLTLSANANVVHTTTVSGTAGTTTITGSNLDRLSAGDKVQFSGNTLLYTIVSSTSGSATVTPQIPLLSSATMYRVYREGDLISLSGKGLTTGTTRSVSATDSTLSINLQETFPATTSAGLIAIAARSGSTTAVEADKALINATAVQISTATHYTGVNGPYGLGVSDLYRIKSIRKKTGSAFTSNTQGTDVTSSFTINNGQKDTQYDHASITPLIGLGATDYLLVEFDHFTPTFSATSGLGYFSVDSYLPGIGVENIPIFTSPTNKITYDLRNYIDFRPVKTATANVVSNTTGGSSLVSVTMNPANSSTFIYETNGLRLPVPSSQISYDYSYYDARRDLIVVDKDGNISVINGIPGSNPQTPLVPDNTMALASLYVTPFPSLAPNYAQMINRKDLSVIVRKLSNKRFTMKDVGTLRDRIVNLEYYASLTTLEKSAVDMQVLDGDGLNRFKNGIFVDTFRDLTLGDINNRDFRIINDEAEKSIRPVFTVDSIAYQEVSNTGVSVSTAGIVTLPYSEANLINQVKVTSFRNLEVSSYRFIGNLYLTPDLDIWVDTEYAEDNAITIGPEGNNLPQTTSTTWNNWQKKVVGYNLYHKTSGKLIATFDATEKDLAFNNAYWLARNLEFNKNTLGIEGGDYTSDVTGGSKFETIVETVYDSTRTGTESFSGISEDTTSLGNRVLDVSLIPYIRPQTIKINAKGLKANTTFYTFFDNEDMTNYVTPLTSTQYNDWPITTTGTEGAALNSNASGEVFGLLRLPPEKRFRVGTKEVTITDSPTNSSTDASSAATSYFVAQGLVQTKQETVITTRQVINLEKEITDVERTTTQYVQQLRPSCSAYSFVPKAPEGEEGVFLTSVDLFVAKKHPTLGIWVEIREMDSSGGITRNQVPMSEVWIESSQLNASDTVPQSGKNTITFPSPIFLQNNVQYAFVIHTIGLNPDTYVWISRLGEEDLNTGSIVTSRPLTGTFYTTNNNLNWDIVPDVDLLINFRRAAFETGVSRTITIGNKPVEKFIVDNVNGDFGRYGEAFRQDEVLTLASANGGISVGDYIIGVSSNVNSAVTIASSPTFYMSNSGYRLESVGVRRANGLTTTIGATISGIVSPSGVLSKYTTKDGTSTVSLASSNGVFRTNATIRGLTSGATANIASIQNYRYSVVDFEPASLTFSKTTISFEMNAASNTGTVGSFANITENENYNYTSERAVLSRTNEVSSFSSNRSQQARATLYSSSEYMSPTLDIKRTQTIIVDNIINSNTLNETKATGGGLLNKYISKPITLAEGQDAEDLLVILTGYRPPSSDIKVYARILNGEDGDSMNDLSWIEMVKTDSSNAAYSSISNQNDFLEYTFKFPTAQMTGPLGEVQYLNSKNIKYTGFKYFAVKVALTGDNSATVPRVADLRAIALQM